MAHATMSQGELYLASQVSPLYVIAGALSMVGGLAWNDAIQSGITAYFPKGGIDSIYTKFIYAILVTGIIVIIAAALIVFESHALAVARGAYSDAIYVSGAVVSGAKGADKALRTTF